MKERRTKETIEITEKIGRERKARNRMTREAKRERNMNIFRNLILASLIMLFFTLLNVGYYTIDKDIYCRDTVIFSFVALITTIIAMERAYRTEKGFYVLHGLELLLAAIYTYFIPYTYFNFDDNTTKIIMAAPAVYVAYYLIKIIIIAIRSRKNKKNDIEDIIKKEEVKDDDSWIKTDKDEEANNEKPIISFDDDKASIKESKQEIVKPLRKTTTKKPTKTTTKATTKTTKESTGTKKTTTRTKTTTGTTKTATTKKTTKTATTKKASSKTTAKPATAKKTTTKRTTTKKSVKDEE